MTTDELKDAAERLQKAATCKSLEDLHELYGHHPLEFESISKTRDAIDRDRTITSDSYLARRAADEQQAREDAEPITEEWLRKIMDEHFVGTFSSRSILLGCIAPECGQCGWCWIIGDVHVAHLSTRGQLRRLLEALKGGA